MNHAQLAVTNVAENRAFFETYFGLRCVADRGAFHIGFGQESRERVNEIHASLKAGGFDPE